MSQTEMTYRPLGKCGTKVSALALGGWTTFGGSLRDEAAARAIIMAAFNSGVNFFDIADVYARGEAERLMGKVFKELPRHRLVISSKVYVPMSDDVNDWGLSRKHIMESIDKSLQRIGTDYLDIYFCHRYDDETPLEETVRAMDDLVHRGKILYWGTSEWTGAQLREAGALCQARGYYRPQVEQPQYSLIVREKFEDDTLKAAQENGLGIVTWSPLAYGMLTGKYDEGVPEGSRLGREEWLRERVVTEENRKRVKRFKEVADGLGVSRAKLALAWTAAQPGVSSVITGATRLEQLQENLSALEVKVTPDVNKALDAIFPKKA